MVHREEIQEVYKVSEFDVAPEVYFYHLVSSYTQAASHLLIIHNGKEITVLTREGNEELLTIRETNPERWRLLNIRCGNPFYCSGFIAGITQVMAEAAIDITIASSFEYDLLLVQEEHLEKAIGCVKKLGIACKADRIIL